VKNQQKTIITEIRPNKVTCKSWTNCWYMA